MTKPIQRAFACSPERREIAAAVHHAHVGALSAGKLWHPKAKLTLKSVKRVSVR